MSNKQDLVFLTGLSQNGLIFISIVTGTVKSKEESILIHEMVNIDDLVNKQPFYEEYPTETWSRNLLEHLPELYRLC